MKKFLSVLLALAVAFTFTFGSCMSAFAAVDPTATDAEYLSAVATAEAEALAAEKVQYDAAVATVKADAATTYTVNGYSIDKANFYKAVDAAYAAAQKDIKDYTATIQQVRNNSFSYPVADAAAILAAANDNAMAYDAAVAQFEADKAALIANIKSVDTTIYSTTEGSVIATIDGKECKSSKAYVDAYLAKAVADNEKVVIDTKADTYAATVAYVKGVAANLTDGDIAQNATTKKYEFQNTAGETLVTVAEEAQTNAQLDAAKAQAKAQVQTYVAGQVVYSLDATDMALYNELKEAYTAIENMKIEAATSTPIAAPATFPAYTISTVDGKRVLAEATTKYVVNYKACNDDANLVLTLKAKKTADGQDYYDAKEIDKIVTAAAQAYTNVSVAVTPFVEADFAAAKYDYAISAFEKEAVKAAVAADFNANTMTQTYTTSTTYYAKEWKAVEAAVAAFNAAVDAATSWQAINAADDALVAALDADKIADVIAVNKLYTTTGDVKTAYTTAYTAIGKYIDSKNALITPDTMKFDTTDLYKWYAAKGARTADEVTALYATLQAEVDAAGTVKEYNDAKTAAEKAVDDAIAALPAALLLTDADKAAVLAAKKALDEYNTTYSASKTSTVLTTDVKVFSDKDDAAIKAAEDKLVVAANATAADKAAIVAAKAMVDAFLADYGTASTKTTYDYTTACAKVKASELANVIAAIDALPANITKDDKA